MAYLVTEIALEMLGCKYYDIYGTQREMNDFQVDDHSSDANCDIENNLETLLKFKKKPVTVDCNESQRNKSDENMEKLVEPSTVSLAELMDTEFDNVRQQILHNKISAMTKRIYTNSPGKNSLPIVKNFLDSELIKLRWETQTMRNFRKIVENGAMDINQSSFEEYCDMFTTCTSIGRR